MQHSPYIGVNGDAFTADVVDSVQLFFCNRLEYHLLDLLWIFLLISSILTDCYEADISDKEIKYVNGTFKSQGTLRFHL